MTRPIESQNKAPAQRSTFAAEALKLGGKSADEVRRMGAVDAADDRVEDLFAERYQTTNSPVHRAVWDSHVPIELFHHAASVKAAPNEAATRVMKDALDVVRRHRQAGTVLDGERKISETVLDELADALAQWLTQARITARAVPAEVRLVRGTSPGTATGPGAGAGAATSGGNAVWDGTLVLNLPAR